MSSLLSGLEGAKGSSIKLALRVGSNLLGFIYFFCRTEHKNISCSHGFRSCEQFNTCRAWNSKLKKEARSMRRVTKSQALTRTPYRQDLNADVLIDCKPSILLPQPANIQAVDALPWTDAYASIDVATKRTKEICGVLRSTRACLRYCVEKEHG
jgi:hypothetical protein